MEDFYFECGKNLVRFAVSSGECEKITAKNRKSYNYSQLKLPKILDLNVNIPSTGPPVTTKCEINSQLYV